MGRRGCSSRNGEQKESRAKNDLFHIMKGMDATFVTTSAGMRSSIATRNNTLLALLRA
jgi:hypothetical protein